MLKPPSTIPFTPHPPSLPLAPLVQMGMLYKDGLDFDSSLLYLQRAAALRPDVVIVLNNLASVLSRWGLELCGTTRERELELWDLGMNGMGVFFST